MNTMEDKKNQIVYKEMKASDIAELSDARTLYTVDFRAISENMTYDIPAMFKYENLMPWVLQGQHVCVNNQTLPAYKNKNNLLYVPMSSDSRHSIYKRLHDVVTPDHIQNLHVCIPHPDAEILAKEKGWTFNATYSDYLAWNDKILQKKYFGEQTPAWELLTENTPARKDIYIKRRQGSGGFTLYTPSDLSDENVWSKIDHNHDWYIEQCKEGLSCSVQVYKCNESTFTVFGFSHQLIEDHKFFSGAILQPLNRILPKHREQIDALIHKVSNHIQHYVGFLGLDFILSDDGKIWALELNIRMTAMTIPTLLFNEMPKGRTAAFMEDVMTRHTDDLVLTGLPTGEMDVLRFLNA